MIVATIGMSLFLYSQARDAVRDSVIYLANVEYQSDQDRLGVDWGRHPLLGDDDTLEEIVDGVLMAADRTEIDPLLILSVAWAESRFSKKIIYLEKRGALGERGIMQVHGVAARGCDMSTIHGQIVCGASWLRIALDHCGTIDGALSWYMTGSVCTPTPRSKLWHYSRNRERIYNDLFEVVNGL